MIISNYVTFIHVGWYQVKLQNYCSESSGLSENSEFTLTITLQQFLGETKLALLSFGQTEVLCRVMG